jgi:hypothetical protein
MSDFFQEPAAMLEMDQSAANNLVIEARAEMNAADSRDDQTILIRRGIGEKFIKIRDIIGRARYLSWTASRAKVSDRQVQRYIQLAESDPNLPIEEQIAILWGNKPKEPKAASSQGNRPAKPAEAAKIWKGWNTIDENVKALSINRETDEDYIGARDMLKGLKKHLRSLIKKAEGK